MKHEHHLFISALEELLYRTTFKSGKTKMLRGGEKLTLRVRAPSKPDSDGNPQYTVQIRPLAENVDPAEIRLQVTWNGCDDDSSTVTTDEDGRCEVVVPRDQDFKLKALAWGEYNLSSEAKTKRLEKSAAALKKWGEQKRREEAKKASDKHDQRPPNSNES